MKKKITLVCEFTEEEKYYFPLLPQICRNEIRLFSREVETFSDMVNKIWRTQDVN